MDDGESVRCSFCGATKNGPLIQGGGEDAGGMPIVHICRECAAASARALAMEPTIVDERRDEASQAAAHTERQLGKISDWASFTHEGQAWRWQASRELIKSTAPVILVRVRRVGGEEVATVNMNGMSKPTERHARLGLRDLLVPKEAPEIRRALEKPPMGILREWTVFEVDGDPFEWQAERIRRTAVAVMVDVAVQNVETGERTSMMFPGDVQPSVDNAHMAAAMLNKALKTTLPPAAEKSDDSSDV